MDEMKLPALASLQKQQMERELSALNEKTSRYGLTLSQREITELAEGRMEALQSSGRVEFGEGILPRLALAFCDSPYLNEENYAESLGELQECFYYYKSAAGERFADEELLSMMREAFDGEAQGSLEYLADTTLAELCRAVNRGEEWEAPGRRPLTWRQYEDE